MILSEVRGRVGVVTIDRHERRNALDLEHVEDLRDAVDALVGEGVRAMVITGAGSSFCSGADLGGVYGPGFRDALYVTLDAISSAPMPVIAAVNGPAIGAGTQVAIACDLRVAAPSAKFAIPTARNGLAVDPWTIRRLALIAGGGAARAILLGCEQLDDRRAYDRGLVDRLGSVHDAMEWAEDLATAAPLTLAYSKRVLESMFEPRPWAEDLDDDFAAVWESEDVEEGVRARLEKRKPDFQGR
ncbi:enoyl-CoA hydratase [Nostocoides sp. F2B08]|uniref:enoyl-CoA hydratase n=1 Tax=Nostocoides sp. F2B08 TaxID=2653936 RepID=UPI0012639178|nr:enoyl-CoA hydratase [Tetrasphaera sp. F2B08]KAB7744828.1 enoyl-CoA hydratase [Tetrasphaera sp. F2B08]